jgi:zinc protease
MTIPSQRPRTVALVCALALAAAPLRAQATDKPVRVPLQPQRASNVDLPQVKITQFALANGLRVILHEDHSSPIVALELWYNGGSKFDPKGRSGLAHMVEHMMDEGTPNMPNGEYKRIIQSSGGYYNAETSNDFVRYRVVVPSNLLETALWLEADRMANLGQSLDSTRFNLEREAVRNEYRAHVLDMPVMSAAEAAFEGLFPDGAYGTPLSGYPSELGLATVEDLRQFYDRIYVPNNAVLVLAGDLTVADARKKVERQFSPIPRGKPVIKPTSVTPFRGEKRLVVEHPSGVRQVWIVWRGAKSASPDRPALIALSSIVTERLRRALMQDRRLAIFINPNWNQHFDLQEAGIFQIAIQPTPTGSATEIEQVIDSVVTSIKTSGVTEAEVRRWVGSYRLQMLTNMQTDSIKAGTLGDGAINLDAPLGAFTIADLALHLKPAEVQAAANKYLTANRIVLSVIPPGKFDLISKPELPYVNASRKGK